MALFELGGHHPNMKGAWLLGCLGLLPASPAWGASPVVVVTPAATLVGCATGDELARRVEQAFGEAELPPNDYTLRVDITPRGHDGLSAGIVWQRPNTEASPRVIETQSRDCRELDDAVSLVARALWDGEQTASSEAAALPPAAAPTFRAPIPTKTNSSQLVATPRSFREQPARPANDVGAPGHVELATGAALMMGVLDGTVVAPRFDARFPLSGRFSLRVAASWVPWGHTVTVDGGHVDLSALTGRVAGCWALPVSISVDACVGVDAGALSTRGGEIKGKVERRRPLLWPLMTLAARYPLVGPLMAQLELGAGPAAFRDDISVTDSSGNRRSVRQPASALLEGGLSLGVVFR